MKKAILIGGGWSVRKIIEKGLWEHIKGKDVWSLNFSFKFMEDIIPSKEIFVDDSVFSKCIRDFWRMNLKGTDLVTRGDNPGYEGLPVKKIKVSPGDHSKFNDREGLEKGLFIERGGLCGSFAISYACALGYDEIFMLGIDYGVPDEKDGRTHWYQDLDPNINAGSYRKTSIYLHKNEPKQEMQQWSKYLESKSKIYNVSQRSNLPFFPKLTWKEFFKKIK